MSDNLLSKDVESWKLQQARLEVEATNRAIKVAVAEAHQALLDVCQIARELIKATGANDPLNDPHLPAGRLPE